MYPLTVRVLGPCSAAVQSILKWCSQPAISVLYRVLPGGGAAPVVAQPAEKARIRPIRSPSRSVRMVSYPLGEAYHRWILSAPSGAQVFTSQQIGVSPDSVATQVP